MFLCSVPFITPISASTSATTVVPRVPATVPDAADVMVDSTEESCVANNQSDSMGRNGYNPHQQRRQRQSIVGLSSKNKPLFTSQQHDRFQRDGFVIVSGLLDDQLDEFVQAGHSFASKAKKSAAYFSIIDMGLVFDAAGESDGGDDIQDARTTKAFRNVAFESKLPQAVAELMHLPPTQNVRLLR